MKLFWATLVLAALIATGLILLAQQTKVPSNQIEAPRDGPDASDSEILASDTYSKGKPKQQTATIDQGNVHGEPHLISEPVGIETVPGLSAWIEDQLLVERPNIQNISVLRIDTYPVVSNADALRLHISSGRVVTVERMQSLDLPNGGMKWAGRIEGESKGIVNLELSEFGAVTARISSIDGRSHIRGSPMLPYHIAYNLKVDTLDHVGER